jgi:hypothetical protein
LIELTMLPGQDGDCLLLAYGDADRTRRVLVDGGRAATYPLVRPTLAALDGGKLDLLVITHVDQDHILGVLAMFRDPDRPVEFSDVWFNGFDHLQDVKLETFGARDGELLTAALLEQKVVWNKAFRGAAVEVGRPLDPFDEEASFLIVSPDRSQLEKLIPVWEDECARHGLIPGVEPVPAVPGFEHFGSVDVDELAATPFEPDSSKTNATSIGFLFEYNGVRILFTGDGDDRRLVASLQPLAEAEGGRIRIDALKVAHHGSDGNISKELLGLIDCRRYLISTSGARHQHPDDVAMARILKFGGTEKEIVFNYRSRAQPWDAPNLRDEFGFSVLAPEEGEDGFITVRWP